MMMLRLKRLRNSLSEVAGMVLEEGGCCDSRTKQSPALSTTVGRNSTSGDGGINLGEKFPKVLKNDSF
ncbi:hypothetical protein [Rhizobium leguminosarum]|uniref:hypothetical protein n=1 Tax=Rhizobium leguminosarum TaxID=384 RepID=UPI000D3C7951|nr:hypothetical protein [Rhizobium leguminosarum]MBB5255317.1 hypothetical protein [Rhizobium leguminosarum]MBY5328434.1 hypothetical protein [Rhizobium leguminosarum]MDX6000659.1 hypothetical protein [Rhizobium leguminosarum]PUB62632.1 hypothetical protein DB728_12710 [Rhizobium leguminosarum bv. viciae USDA 2370]TBZ50705.1 hypothetical protein E0H42_20915 [Rhizobium leguminosarum bv. viciae]